MSMEVLFASVPVVHLDTAVAWYERLFGRPPDIVPHENEVMWRVTQGGWLYVIRDPARAGRTLVTIAVADLDQLVDELTARGLHPGPIESVGEAGRKATSIDADGNVISLIEVTPGGRADRAD